MFGGTRIPTHTERIAQLDAKYDFLINEQGFIPYGYPFGSWGAYLVIIYLLIPHLNRPILRRMRYVVWAVNAAFSIYIITHTRGRGAVLSYAVGLGTWWSVLWATTVLIAYDGQAEFTRIERAQGTTKTLSTADEKKSGRNDTIEEDQKTLPAPPDVVWQDYPTTSFIERLDWVLDLMTNFRGVAWNWSIANTPDPPKEVQEALRHSPGGHRKKLGRTRAAFQPRSRQILLSESFRQLLVGYLCLDLIRTLMIHDPYFQGQGTQLTPSYLRQSLRESPVFMQSYRLLMALFAVYWALATIFQLAPLFFVGILGSKLIGVRGEPWMYPKEWGSYSTVLNRGLGGFWGDWWHQTFRFAFEAFPGRITEMLSIEARSVPGKTIQLLIAFSLSGSIHGFASYTSIGETRPVRGPFLFFFLQSFGIIIQLALSKVLKNAGITQRLPLVVRQMSNFTFVHVWLYYTAPLLVDDLVQGGQFLYEPVPFSLLRLLGFGNKGDSWCCWDMKLLRWHSGEHWWESGIAS